MRYIIIILVLMVPCIVIGFDSDEVFRYNVSDRELVLNLDNVCANFYCPGPVPISEGHPRAYENGFEGALKCLKILHEEGKRDILDMLQTCRDRYNVDK